MSIQQQLHDTIPTNVPPLDHADLQRRGRLRRWTSRAATGVAAGSAIAAIGAVGLATLPAGVEVAGPGGDTSDLSPASASESPTPEPTPSAELSPGASPQFDPAVAAAWDGLSHDNAVARLQAVLDDHPHRPEDLETIEVIGSGDTEVIENVPVGFTDFPVIDVSDDDFVADGRFETPALVPTWTQQAARNALDSLAVTDTFGYAGITVDPLGRTVLVFDAHAVDQQIWIDPASGYTAGARYGDATPASEDDTKPETASGDMPTEG